MKKIFLLLLLIIAFLSGRKLYYIFQDYKQASSYYIEMQSSFIKNIEIMTPTSVPNITTTATSIIEEEKKEIFSSITTSEPIIFVEQSSLNTKKTTKEKIINPHSTNLKPPIQVDFTALKAINSDVIGWLYSENTPINYPILHSSNNITYIHHLMNGEYSASGSIFLDSICNSKFTDDNSILYGHHMRDGSMFASLKKYENQDYYDNHNQLWLLTPKKNYLIIPFSGMVVSSHSHYYNNFIENKQDFINEAVKYSLFIPIEIPNIADKLITLSTCDYTFDDARFILIGILIPIY